MKIHPDKDNPICQPLSEPLPLQDPAASMRFLLEVMPDAYFETDARGNFTYVNGSFCNLLLYAPEELKGINFIALTVPEARTNIGNTRQKIKDSGDSGVEIKADVVCKDGRIRPMEFQIAKILGPSGKWKGLRGVGRELPRNTPAPGVLTSEQMYKLLADNLTDVVWILDPDLKYVYVSPSVEKLRGYTPEEVLIQPVEKTLTPESYLRAVEMFARENTLEQSGCKHGKDWVHKLELEMYRKDGTTVWTEVKLNILYDEAGQGIGILGVTRDISERKIIEQELRQSEERFREMAKYLPETIFETDMTGKITYVNDISFKRFGYSPEDFERGINLTDVIAKEDIERVLADFQSVLKDENRGLDEYLVCRKDGSTFPALIHSNLMVTGGKHAGIRGFLVDMSEKKAMENQILRAQKMEAIGTLAGGIAHDFNNLLMGILGNVSLMMMDMDENHEFYERLNNMEDYVRRGAELTNRLLGFARGGKYEVRTTHLGKFISKSAEMFGRARKEIRISENVEDGLWYVDVDRGQMDQVLLNLFVNAWQAMPGGGDLCISVENVILEEPAAATHDATPGRYVKLTVTDSGHGMDEATKARIFEPFFSTKERGHGTGLGLASVYGMIKNHGGFIDVVSAKGKGSSFIIYLPAVDKTPSEDPRKDNRLHRGKEKILFIDDEDMILDVGKKMLEGLGFVPLVACGGKQGVTLFEEQSDRIDLVILDMIMPDMGGKETYDALKRMKPSVKVLLASGYSLDSQAKAIMAQGCKGFIQKPFNAAELSNKIRDILEQ